MTVQLAEKLESDHPGIVLDHLELYGIRDVVNKHPAPDWVSERKCTALYRGYVSTYRLNSDGTLDLIEQSDPFAKKSTKLRHRIEGNFKMHLRPYFFGPNVTIPFLNSKIVEDQSQWIGHPTRFGAVAEQILINSNQEIYGIDLKAAGHPFFLPKVFIEKFEPNLESLIGREIYCEAVPRRKEFDYSPTVVKPLDLGDPALRLDHLQPNQTYQARVQAVLESIVIVTIGANDAIVPTSDITPNLLQRLRPGRVIKVTIRNIDEHRKQTDQCCLFCAFDSIIESWSKPDSDTKT